MPSATPPTIFERIVRLERRAVVSPGKHLNFSAVVSLITLGCIGWMGVTTFQNSVTLAAIAASQITRPELDTKLGEIRVEIVRLQSRQVDTELQLARLASRVITTNPHP